MASSSLDYKDYYAVLGVPKTASQADIKKAFRKLAREHHPDAKPGDAASERRFKDINEANEVLSDPARRKQYDELGANWESISRSGGTGASRDPAGYPFGYGGGPAGGAAGAQAEPRRGPLPAGGAAPPAATSATSSGRAATPVSSQTSSACSSVATPRPVPPARRQAAAGDAPGAWASRTSSPEWGSMGGPPPTNPGVPPRRSATRRPPS